LYRSCTGPVRKKSVRDQPPVSGTLRSDIRPPYLGRRGSAGGRGAKLYVEKLKAPQAGRLEVWDTEQRCFGIRVTQNDVETWTLKYKYRGRQRRMVLGYYPEMSLAEARKLAQKKLGELAKGDDPSASKNAAPEARLADLIEAYMQRHAKLRNKEISWRQENS
jgi:hypothetical protein